MIFRFILNFILDFIFHLDSIIFAAAFIRKLRVNSVEIKFDVVAFDVEGENDAGEKNFQTAAFQNVARSLIRREERRAVRLTVEHEVVAVVHVSDGEEFPAALQNDAGKVFLAENIVEGAVEVEI